MTAPYKRKLIEVALPLEAINVASAREKSIRHGHPSTLHLWWARRPLAACRAVLFASLVDDPSSDPERFPTPKAVEEERTRLFGIIERLVLWENTTNEVVLDEARAEILRSTGGNPPPVLDPFCGGGSIPLEAQRLGLTAYASDLNPVAVLITKALIEIPPRFADMPPVHPDAQRGTGSGGAWKGAAGLAEDVRRYGAWMRDEAERRIGHLYPKVKLPKEQGGGEATVIAWLWSRTVTCPNPVCRARMPLAATLELSRKRGRRKWAQPLVDRTSRSVRFQVSDAEPAGLTPKLGRGATFQCVVCRQVAGEDYIKSQAAAGGLESQLMAVVAEGNRSRVYVSPDAEQEAAPRRVQPGVWSPDATLSRHPQYMAPARYGLTEFGDLFSNRQLAVLNVLGGLLEEVRATIESDAVSGGRSNSVARLPEGGVGAAAYADAVVTYLAFAIDKGANYWSQLCGWHRDAEKMVSTFGLPVYPMVWDWAEANPFSDSSGNLGLAVEQVAKALSAAPSRGSGAARLEDARDVSVASAVVSTDPPYYDNVPYGDLSDFFYVWLRHFLAPVWGDLFSTILVPKEHEMVADSYRRGGREAAARYFESGLESVFAEVHRVQQAAYPVSVFYAFRQSEYTFDGEGEVGVVSTAWETMLRGLLAAGMTVIGTWPMRTEQPGGLRQAGRNALASSIVLVCRPRHADAGLTDRKGFLAALKAELPDALRDLQHGNIAPVDLAQASIGPGMAVFSRYSKVVEPDGSTMSVRTALMLINQVLTEVLAQQEDEFDADTRWAVTWFEQFGHAEAPFGQAEVLSKAKDTAMNALVTAGIVVSSANKVRLKRRDELDADWDPATDRRLTVWEVTQHLIRSLDSDGEPGAADLVRRVGGLADTARDLAYRLYAICERKKWAEEALGYNALVTAWPEITRLAASEAASGPTQGQLFG